VSVELPSELAWVLDLLGFNWPNVDEDKLRAAAAADRELAARVTMAHGHADTAAEIITSRNSGASIDAFSAHANKVSVHLGRLQQVYDLTADALDAIAVVVEGAKIAVVAQLAALAAEIAAAAAASIFTFGLSDAAGLAATALTRITVEQILDELERQVISYAEMLIGCEALSALSASISSLAGQGVSDYVGTGHGINVGAAAQAGGSAAAGSATGLGSPGQAGLSLAAGTSSGLSGQLADGGGE
jgi:collagen type III alpha